MGGEGYPYCPFLNSREMGEPVGKIHDPYERVRGDSGQRRRILLVAVVLGAVAFLPVAVQLYRLMVIDHASETM